jgi:CRISPR type I-E-associated protein CasB/Cse2
MTVEGLEKRPLTSQSKLIGHLIGLAQTVEEVPRSRAELAQLRQGWIDPLRAARHVAPYLDDERDGADFYLIAKLFALHRKDEKGMTLGKAFQKLYEKKDKAESIEKRFLTVLSVPREQLDAHLRNAVTLLDSAGIGLDWGRLLSDIQAWEREGKPRQHQLARDFYYKPTQEEENSNEN